MFLKGKHTFSIRLEISTHILVEIYYCKCPILTKGALVQGANVTQCFSSSLRSDFIFQNVKGSAKESIVHLGFIYKEEHQLLRCDLSPHLYWLMKEENDVILMIIRLLVLSGAKMPVLINAV